MIFLNLIQVLLIYILEKQIQLFKYEHLLMVLVILIIDHQKNQVLLK